MSNPDPYERLHARLSAFRGGDTAPVLEPETLEEIGELWSSTAIPGGYPLSTVLTIGTVHWCRYLFRPVGPDQDDLDGALHVLGAVLDTHGDVVPLHLKELLRTERPAVHGHWLAAQARALLKGGFNPSDPDALRKTADLLAAALEALPADDAERPADAELLGSVLVEQHQISRRPADLDASIRFERRLLREGPGPKAQRVSALVRLAGGLFRRFSIKGELTDLDEAIGTSRALLTEMPDGGPDRVRVLSNLGFELRRRFERTGDRESLDEAVSIGREAVELAASELPGDAGALANLTGTMVRRFEATGALRDLDETIELGRRAVELAAPGSEDLTVSLTNLANALIRRFQHVGFGEDADAAVEYACRAAAATPAGDHRRTIRLSALAGALMARFHARGDGGDLDEAIETGREVLASAPLGDRFLSGRNSNLTSALLARYRRDGNPADLDEAVDLGYELVAATARESPDRVAHLTNLANALLTRSETPGHERDLDAAIALGREAVESEGPQIMRFAAHRDLAGALAARFERDGDWADLDESIQHYRQVSRSETAPAAARIQAAQAAASRLVQRGKRAYDDAEPGLNARTMYYARLGAGLAEYQIAIELLPLLVWTGATRQDRWSGLDQAARTLGREAASCALAMGDAQFAVRALEQSRGLLWSQMLDLRDDFSGLKAAHPELAAALEECRRILDAPDAAGAAQSDLRISMARRFLDLTRRIRELEPTDDLPRPQDFLRPPRFEDLLPPSDSGPVVLINTSSWRSDAIVLWRDQVSVVELDFTEDVASAHADRYTAALRRYSGTDQSLQLEMASRPVLEWMWEAIAEPVLSEVERRHDADELPRIWWCPTGKLTLLPIHAAGYHYREDGTALLDRAVSSYTPTLRSLAHSRASASASASDGAGAGDGGAMLVVAAAKQEAAPPEDAAAFPDLPGAERERWMLEGLLGEDAVQVLSDGQASRDAVLDELAGRAFVHIACHGVQDLDRPAEGGLVPFDWRDRGLISVNDLAGLPSCRRAERHPAARSTLKRR
jgi:CHAT domain-containing protein